MEGKRATAALAHLKGRAAQRKRDLADIKAFQK
jgi:hypothetical protein